jgi:hypothetical protein
MYIVITLYVLYSAALNNGESYFLTAIRQYLENFLNKFSEQPQVRVDSIAFVTTFFM